MRAVKIGDYGVHGENAPVYFLPDTSDALFELIPGAGEVHLDDGGIEDPRRIDGTGDVADATFMRGRLLMALGIPYSDGAELVHNASPDLLDRYMPQVPDTSLPGMVRSTGKCAVFLYRQDDGGQSVSSYDAQILEYTPEPAELSAQ